VTAPRTVLTGGDHRGPHWHPRRTWRQRLTEYPGLAAGLVVAGAGCLFELVVARLRYRGRWR